MILLGRSTALAGLSCGMRSRPGWGSVRMCIDHWLGGICGTEAAANGLWLALKAVISLLTTDQDTTLLLEFGHGDGWKVAERVVLGCVVVDLVDLDLHWKSLSLAII